MIKNLYLIYAVALILIILNPACNEGNNKVPADDEETEKAPEDVQENTNFDELDRKMSDIMNDDVNENEKEIQEVKVVKAQGAGNVKVDLSIGAGKLRLTSGSSELMLAGFIYTNKNWKPSIDYALKGNTGILSIKQPDSRNNNIQNDDKYVWNLKFNNQIPLDFRVELGAGLSEIKLGDLNISDFSMEMGVGKTEIDLRGNWKKSTNIKLTGGIGHAKIFIPNNVGVKLNIEKGIGSVDIRGLNQKDKNHYANALSESSNVIINITLRTGIGRIEVE